MSIAADFKTGVNQIVSIMGTDCQHQSGAAPAVVLRVAISAIPKEDGELINAIGIDGSLGYVLPATPGPKKYDSITTPTGTVYAVHIVSEILVSGELIGYRLGLKQ